MMKILNSVEVDCISGGWICAGVYKGKSFLKATWHADIDDRFGACHYGLEDEKLFYVAPLNLTGIVQKPMNFWSFAGDMTGYSSYECIRNDASKCVFEEE